MVVDGDVCQFNLMLRDDENEDAELLADYGAGFWDFEEEEGKVGGQLEEGTESAAESGEAAAPQQGGEEGSVSRRDPCVWSLC